MEAENIKAMVFYQNPSPTSLVMQNVRIAITHVTPNKEYSKETTYFFIDCSDKNAIEILKMIAFYEGIRPDGLMFYSMNRPLEKAVDILRETNLINCNLDF